MVSVIRLLAISLVISTLAISNADAEHGQLAGDDILLLLNGTKVVAADNEGKIFEVEFYVDGGLRFTRDDYTYSDEGLWRVNGSEYCSTWAKLSEGAEECWHVFHLEGTRYRFEGLYGAEDIYVDIEG